MRAFLLKPSFLLCLFVVLIIVMMLSPTTTARSTAEDGITTTEFRRHYPLDIEDGGIGQYLDTQVCIDRANLCMRSKRVFFTYPAKQITAPWIEICDPATSSSRFFNRISGRELKCINCDAESLRCPKPPQTGTWFDNGNKSSELVGYVKDNLSTVRAFTYTNADVTMHEFPDLKGVAYGAGEVISEWFYGDKSALTWIQCDNNKCVYYGIDFNTGKSTQEATPCDSNDRLTLVLVGNRPEIRVDFEAKGDEICRNTEGKPAYPLGPAPFIVDPLRVDPPVDVPSTAYPVSGVNG
jgi:hypothetical protein